MTQQELPLSAPRQRKPSLTDKLEGYFKAHAGEWVAEATIADLVGHAGCRQRRLECEQRGLVIVREWRGRALGRVYRPAGPREAGA
jgi:hypothetical protein